MRARRLPPLRVGGLGVSSSTEAVCGVVAAASSLTVLSEKNCQKDMALIVQDKNLWRSFHSERHALCDTKGFGNFKSL